MNCKKRILCAIVCLFSFIVLCACGSTGGQTGDDTSGKDQTKGAGQEAATVQEQTESSTQEAASAEQTEAVQKQTESSSEAVSDPEGFLNGNVSKKGVTINAVFLGIDKQPVKDDDGETDTADTIWIYYTDNTFEQFAFVNDKTVLFSIGTYELSDGEDFIYDSQDKDQGKITINRTKKYELGNGLVDHVSSHTYDLGTMGFTQVYAPDAPRKLVSIFSGPEKQPFDEIDKEDNKTEKEMIDTWWLYFDDNSFEQYAEVDDNPELFSIGTYEFTNNGSFDYMSDPEDQGDIIINRTKKYADGKGLVKHESSHHYTLETLGFDQLVAILPE